MSPNARGSAQRTRLGIVDYAGQPRVSSGLFLVLFRGHCTASRFRRTSRTLDTGQPSGDFHRAPAGPCLRGAAQCAAPPNKFSLPNSTSLSPIKSEIQSFLPPAAHTLTVSNLGRGNPCPCPTKSYQSHQSHQQISDRAPSPGVTTLPPVPPTIPRNPSSLPRSFICTSGALDTPRWVIFSTS